MRQHRARKADGKVMLLVEVDELMLADMLVMAGLLDRNNDDREVLTNAVVKFWKRQFWSLRYELRRTGWPGFPPTSKTQLAPMNLFRWQNFCWRMAACFRMPLVHCDATDRRKVISVPSSLKLYKPELSKIRAKT